MAFKGPGPGRPPGLKNKRTIEAEARLAELNCDPLAFMASVMLDEAQPIDLRCKMAAELTQYIAPKRKAVEHTGEIAAVPFVILGATPDATAAEWERRNQETMQ